MHQKVWQNCLGLLEKRLSKATYQTWFLPIKIQILNDNEILLNVKNQFTADWIQEHYHSILNQVIAQVIGKNIKVHFTFSENETTASQDPVIQEESLFSEDSNSSNDDYTLSLNKKYTFTNFVVGNCNEFAYTASLKVATYLSETNYNPLFIYGSSGLGKTHLLQAIGNFADHNGGMLKICFISSESFTSQFIDSVKNKTITDFNKYFRNVDLLLIDDIHFITKKERTQEEFFHTFNDLYNSGKQIVMTSDRAPTEIKDVDERLITRFQSGLVVDIQQPDLETRMAILKKKSEFYQLNLTDDIFLFLSNNFTSNVRELEGIITRLSAFHSLSGIPLSLPLCKEILKDMIPKKSDVYSIEKIQKIISKYFGLSEKQLIDKGRSNAIAIPRMIAMYLCRELSKETLTTIGLKFGGRDHSTVFNACERIQSLSAQDSELSDKVIHLRHLIEIS
ncbi:MAG: chromosomal replication initiator protein DnaA [Candidatus Delongbacteria bacterium]|nr:chromosomal replication initiator protein DnaA [Candidatus Delongbacteria bacterium]